MTLTSMFARAEKLVADNSPTILTAVAVTGTVTTAFFTGKASFKAAAILSSQDPHETVVEKGKRVWKCYIPAASTGALTIACIIASNRIGTRRAAAVAAAMTVSERAWEEYRDKVVERFGEQKEQRVRDEVAEDRVKRDPLNNREVIIASNGDVLFYDTITGRYFMSSVEAIKSAVNKINHEINNNMYATLYDFYSEIGLPPSEYSQEVGWTGDELLDVYFSATLADDGRPCVVVSYQSYPIRDYNRMV